MAAFGLQMTGKGHGPQACGAYSVVGWAKRQTNKKIRRMVRAALRRGDDLFPTRKRFVGYSW